MTKQKPDAAEVSQRKKNKKAGRRLHGLEKKGKLKRHVRDKIKAIDAEKSKHSLQKALNIEDDWVAERQRQFQDEDEDDILPLDMLDADIDWDNTPFAAVKRRHDARKVKEEDESDDEKEGEKRRKFNDGLAEDQEEMLPIKLSDGTILRPTRTKEIKEEAADEGGQVKFENDLSDDKPRFVEEDFSHLHGAQLHQKHAELVQLAIDELRRHERALTANPQENIHKLREILSMCKGENQHSLVREQVQQLSMAHMVKVLLDLIPGYPIRPMSETETGGAKLKKETRKLVTFEETLLRYYVKLLQYLEKQSNRLLQKRNTWDEKVFSHKFAVLAVKSMGRLLLGAPHFNYANNIVTTLVRLTLSSHAKTVENVCAVISQLFARDVSLKITSFACKTIADLVRKKPMAASPSLLRTFLSLTIKEVASDKKNNDKDRLIAKKYQIKKERKNKTAKKFDKQIKKLESDLKEVEAAESITSKLKMATESMKHVFQVYFSILKRMPNLYCLEPVLAGLSKYAHLLNVEFLEDIIKCLEDLVDQKHLRLIDRLQCINTVFVILSGQGQVLNVDPCRFYRTMYRLLNTLPFETDPEVLLNQVLMLAKSLDIMFNVRKKQVPVTRVASFFKRLLCMAVLFDDRPALVLLALCRSFFISHPNLSALLEDDETGPGITSIYAPSMDDPDISGAMGSDARPFLRKLHVDGRAPEVRAFANNMLKGLPPPDTHSYAKMTVVKPWKVLEHAGADSLTGRGAQQEVTKFAQKKSKQKLTSQNVFTITEEWVERVAN
ncbi:unnamed protein product, partial [Mesorhabditis spiculigera]